MPRRLYLVRHGETEANRLKILEGRVEGFPEYGSPLNNTGLSQASLLGRALEKVNIDHMYMSPARRAVETAYQICIWNKVDNMPRSVTPSLVEINFGVLEGLNGNKAREKYPDFFKTYHEKPSQTVFPKGESVVGACNRVGLALSKIFAAHTFSENILIVSHGGVMAFIFINIFKLDLDIMFHAIRHHNCCLSIIEWEKPDNPKIVCLNDISHLKDEHTIMIKGLMPHFLSV